MLVLTRKKGERLMIGDDIVVTVIDVRGDGVRIGFDAPRGVSIQRAEVVAAVQAANTGAAASAAETQDLLVGLLNRSRQPAGDAGSRGLGSAADADAPSTTDGPGAAPDGPPPAEPESARVQPPRSPAGPPKPGPRRPRA